MILIVKKVSEDKRFSPHLPNYPPPEVEQHSVAHYPTGGTDYCDIILPCYIYTAKPKAKPAIFDTEMLNPLKCDFFLSQTAQLTVTPVTVPHYSNSDTFLAPKVIVLYVLKSVG